MNEPFLTAAWRYLVLLNFRVSERLLAPYVPRGTAVDTWQGDAWISLVGFRFLDTRFLGAPIPGHRHFPEINLRFYVRSMAHDRRGVVFLKEIVPRRAVAIVARAAYNEPYVARTMRAEGPVTSTDEPGTVSYAWRRAGRWHRFGVTSSGPPLVVPHGTDTAFMIEHYWGYTRQRDESTLEYQVEHPCWRCWAVRDVRFEVDAAAEYDAPLAEAMAAGPASAVLADGSDVSVSAPSLLR